MHVWRPPLATLVTEIAIFVGARTSSAVPVPTWPYALRPQQ